MRGDLQEGHVYDKRLCGYASRCQLPLFPVPIPVSPSTKSRFLCAFGLRDPHFQAFRAQNRHFCVRMGIFPQVFGPFEHKIGVFVLFLPSEPPFSGISSTKSRFLCFFGVWNPRFQASRAQNWGFCALWMWNSAQVLAVTIAVAVALTVAKVPALTTILAAGLALDMAAGLSRVLA